MRFLEVREAVGAKYTFARLLFNEPPKEAEMQVLRELCDKHSLEIIEGVTGVMDIPELIDAIKDEYEPIDTAQE